MRRSRHWAHSVAEVLTAAKTDLKAGEVLDGIGGFHCYGMVDNIDVALDNELPADESC